MESILSLHKAVTEIEIDRLVEIELEVPEDMKSIYDKVVEFYHAKDPNVKKTRIESNIFLAGGAISDLYIQKETKKEADIKDLDIFVYLDFHTNKKYCKKGGWTDKNPFHIKSRRNIFEEMFPGSILIDNYSETLFPRNDYDYETVKKVCKIEYAGYIIDFILIQRKTEDLLAYFDLRFRKFRYTGGKVFAYKGAMKDIQNQVINVSSFSSYKSTFFRIFKMKNKYGFDISNTSVAVFLLKIQEKYLSKNLCEKKKGEKAPSLFSDVGVLENGKINNSIFETIIKESNMDSKNKKWMIDKVNEILDKEVKRVKDSKYYLFQKEFILNGVDYSCELDRILYLIDKNDEIKHLLEQNYFTVELDKFSVFNLFDSKKIFNKTEGLIDKIGETYEKYKIVKTFEATEDPMGYELYGLLQDVYYGSYFNDSVGSSKGLYIGLILEELGRKEKGKNWVNKIKGRTRIKLSICRRTMTYNTLGLLVDLMDEDYLIGKIYIQYSKDDKAYLIKKYSDEYMYIDLKRLDIICNKFEETFGEKLIRK